MAIKRTLHYVAGWGVVVFFFGLLTLIFSFLGSFFCAALAGMMVGSVKFSRVKTAALSLIGPGVLYGFLHFGRAELAGSRIMLLSGLSFGIFWLTYVVVRLVVCYEQKNQPVQLDAQTPRAASLEGEPASSPGRVVGELDLKILQGDWSCTPKEKITREQKRMVIADAKLVLTVSDPFGNVSFFGEGQLSLNRHQDHTGVIISRFARESPGDTLVSI